MFIYGILGVAITCVSTLVFATSENNFCNGQKPCADQTSVSPNPCTPDWSHCSVTIISPDPCPDCSAGGKTDDCIVISATTGTQTACYYGLCSGGSCIGARPDPPTPITCYNVMQDTWCIPMP